MDNDLLLLIILALGTLILNKETIQNQLRRQDK